MNAWPFRVLLKREAEILIIKTVVSRPCLIDPIKFHLWWMPHPSGNYFLAVFVLPNLKIVKLWGSYLCRPCLERATHSDVVTIFSCIFGSTKQSDRETMFSKTGTSPLWTIYSVLRFSKTSQSRPFENVCFCRTANCPIDSLLVNRHRGKGGLKIRYGPIQYKSKKNFRRVCGQRSATVILLFYSWLV